jgi:hypothetical protein
MILGMLGVSLLALLYLFVGSDDRPTAATAKETLQKGIHADTDELLLPLSEKRAALEPDQEEIVEEQQDEEAAIAKEVLPPGVLRVLVTADGDPCPGIPVYVRVDTRGTMAGRASCEERTSLSGETNEGRTDIDGIAGFDSLEPGSHLVRIEPAELEPRQATITLTQSVGRTLHFAIGGGGVEGTVYGADGVGVAGHCIHMSFAGPKRTTDSFVGGVKSGVDGSFRFAGLAPGMYWIQDGNSGEPAQKFSLEQREWKRIDLGASPNLGTWRGRVLLSSGTPAEFSGQMTANSTTHGQAVTFPFDVEGFEVSLPAGEWNASIWGVGGPIALGRVRVGAGTTTQDLVLAGAVVSGSIAYQGTCKDPEEPARSVHVWLGPAEGEGEKSLARRDGQHYVFIGVKPGDYRVTTFPQPLLGAPQIAIHVPDERTQVILDVTITDP